MHEQNNNKLSKLCKTVSYFKLQSEFCKYMFENFKSMQSHWITSDFTKDPLISTSEHEPPPPQKMQSLIWY